MVEVQTHPSTAAFSLRNWHILARILTGIYLFMLSAGTLSLPFLNAQWFSQPSLGALFLPGMRVSAILPPTTAPTLPATSALQVGDRLLRLDGAATPNGAALLRALGNRPAGKEVFLSVLDHRGQMTIRIQVLQNWQPRWRLFYGEVPNLLGAVAILLAWLAFLRFGQSESGRATAMVAASLGFVLGGSSDLLSTHALVPLWMLALGIMAAAQFDLSLSFAVETLPWSNLERVRRTGYFTAAAVALGSYTLLIRDAPRFSPLVWHGLIVLHAISALASGIVLVIYARRSQTSLERNRALGLLAALALAFPALGQWLGGLLFNLRDIARVVAILPAFTLALPVAATIILFSTVRMTAHKYVLTRTALYGLLAVGYALLATGLTFLIGGRAITTRPVTLAGIFILLALSLLPLHRALEHYLETTLFQSDRALNERLSVLMRELTHTVGLPQILAILRRAIHETLHPKILHIYLHDLTSDDYLAAPDESGQLSSDLRFGRNSALVQTLSQQSTMLYIADPARLPATLYGEQARLALLGAQVYFPLKTRQHLAGWIALGPRRSGQPYTTREYTFISALADQVSLAVERSQVINDLNQRMRQMNVLIRVAQGVNITLTMEDMYELIYAQSTQIIPADAFQLLLYDSEHTALRVVFDVLHDERLNERENRLVSLDTTLEGTVLRQRKALLTDDYTRECRARGILSPQADLYAWIGVPLNAGAETIGVLALGALDPEVHYTHEQLDLLQAIADQAAGAIVKARLLDEAERRARQLKILNDVTQKLSSTLTLEPLLQSILENAVDILACEAGSLLLWDEPSDELVFRVVLGPVAHHLVNQRMPSDKGLAGKTFQTRTAQIVNNVSTSPEWFRVPDEMTGFTTRAVLAVPLVVKERAIGVLEVVNRKDGKGFTHEDADLLGAFAAQAAIAIENARLYTMTDQALAARVEELSVMQRIDRELNATLDLRQAMEITLRWALRRSAASAGLIGLLEDSTLQPIAWHGLPEGLTPEAASISQRLPLKPLREVNKPLKRTLGDKEAPALLENACTQVLLPIFREKDLSALIVLESPDPAFCPDDVLDFLQRLCDHAAIALANAQLYAAVRSANLAKNEFVSFVAHELKNPMTSIKGYTELLIAGAVGPVNEAQASFLSVIRSNVDRMSTLVSDLNDLSKIEAGRMRLEFASLALSEIVAEVERSTRRQIEEKQQQLSINLPPDLPPVWADRTRLIQILVNLVSNAHKYTDPGGQITLGAERTHNRWDPAGAREVVHIWVQDTGIGIAPEDQPRIFQKFFRSEDPKTREVPGTGLGLNITRSLVEMQGGKIWFESEYRKGTTFHFTVPVAEIA